MSLKSSKGLRVKESSALGALNMITNEILYLEPLVDKSLFINEDNQRVYLNPEINNGLMIASVII